jgi:hypothetical protein
LTVQRAGMMVDTQVTALSPSAGAMCMCAVESAANKVGKSMGKVQQGPSAAK